MLARWVVLGTKHADVMPPGQLTTEVKGVDLRPRLVARQKVVDGMQDAQARMAHASSLNQGLIQFSFWAIRVSPTGSAVSALRRGYRSHRVCTARPLPSRRCRRDRLCSLHLSRTHWDRPAEHTAGHVRCSTV